MRRRGLIPLVALGLVVMWIGAVAWAALHEVSGGNFYFRDNATGSTSEIRVVEGDQIRFTMVEDAPVPHSVEIDALGIHSGDMQSGDTFTTPALNQPGTYTVYCDRHRERGHVITLVVENDSSEEGSGSGSGSDDSGSDSGSGSGDSSTGSQEGSKSGTGKDQTNDKKGSGTTRGSMDGEGEARSPRPTSTELVPSGAGTVTDAEQAAMDALPNSFEQTLGRPIPEGPWTRSLTLALFAVVPLVVVAVIAIRRGRRRTSL